MDDRHLTRAERAAVRLALSPAEQEVWDLVVAGNKTPAQAAVILGKTAGSVRVEKRRAIARARAAVEEVRREAAKKASVTGDADTKLDS